MPRQKFIPLHPDTEFPGGPVPCGLQNLEPLTLRLLFDRGITTREQYDRFLNPSFEDLYDPALLPDMGKAVRRIRQAVEKGENIIVYGDYDADGTCATAILIKQLRKMGASPGYFIPSRHRDGYGLHIHTLENLIEKGADLIITVDTGITAPEEVRFCTERGTDVIVTDHHIQNGELPDCCAVVAASREDSSYPDPNLCGAGIAYKLACALHGKPLGGEYIALAAVATLADIVSLQDENRMIVQLGMPQIRENSGLSALLDESGYQNQPDYTCVSYVIAPRLNAAGRMGDASRIVRLLTGTDPFETSRLASEIEQENRNRKNAEEEIFRTIESDYADEYGKPAVVIYHPGWNPGVLGIAASKLVEKYGKPAVIFTDMNGTCSGSGRSVPEIPLYESLLPFTDFFLRFGGHARAVGLAVAPERFAEFKKAYERYLADHYKSDGGKRFYYDYELRIQDLTLKFAKEIITLAPFGEGNPAPVFKISHASVGGVRQIGRNGVHLDMVLSEGRDSIRTVAFQAGEEAESYRSAQFGDFLVRLQINSFRGVETPEALLAAGNLYEPSAAGPDAEYLSKIKKELLCHNGCDYAIIKNSFLDICADRESPVICCDPVFLRAVYASVAGRIRKTGGIGLDDLHDPSVLFGVCVFSELGFLEPDPGRGILLLRNDAPRRQLSESGVFRSVSDFQSRYYGG
ncbi:MAG: single-stranded-DNA-specific exonuclease RecJ [Clostridia bacterium]|nr:single-stranded-DNA-specific exonuclease RecJ [Clostridia bacterium]